MLEVIVPLAILAALAAWVHRGGRMVEMDRFTPVAAERTDHGNYRLTMRDGSVWWVDAYSAAHADGRVMRTPAHWWKRVEWLELTGEDRWSE